MGLEIETTRFSAADFRDFHRRLTVETELLAQWLEAGRCSDDARVGGFELEAWLVDRDFNPAPCNSRFLAALGSEQVVPELAKYNVEFNITPRPLHGNALAMFHADLGGLWQRACRLADSLGYHLLMTGILPTVTQAQLNLQNMSDQNRYRALNEQVFAQRRGRPLHLDIPGRQPLHLAHPDVMLEAAATSFQIHLQVPAGQFVRYFNSALLLSGPMVAVSANSPYLFSHDLWEETRIPLFEQAVQVGGFADAAQGPIRRVTFGADYLQHNVLECFRENLLHYPALLPIVYEQTPAALAHLRLHNGTIWRWNRPLLGFDAPDRPHLRLEHRVMAGGPTVVDEIANAAFFFGVAHALANEPQTAQRWPAFSTCRDNFYQGARNGLQAQFTWLGETRVKARTLLAEHLLPLARQGLHALDITAADSELYLDIIARRLASGQTGAAWQRAFVARHGPDMAALTAAYYTAQQSGRPVHEWPV